MRKFSLLSVSLDLRFRVSGFECPCQKCGSRNLKQETRNFFGGVVNPEPLCSLQLCIFLDQLLQTESWELYRNLRVLTFSFAQVDGALAVLGVANLLAGAEASFAFGLLYRDFRQVELLAAGSEELGDVID